MPETVDLKDKVAFVTGAASGLGAAISRRLIERGARVVLADLAGDKAKMLADSLDPEGERTLPIRLDVSSEQGVSHAVGLCLQRFGALDILINNAGTDVTASLEEVGVEAWTRVLNTNLLGPFLLTKLALPALKDSDGGQGGQVVNITSTAAVRAWPNASAYHASKWGLLGLSRALHAELRSSGVRVSALVTGGMRTPFLLDRFPELDPQKLQDPARVAEAVCFMLDMPRDAIVAELTIVPPDETSWP
ncbi:short-chain dehydrogenase [Aquabacterium olei]|uniref:Short-chain dehydrogenase n=1 Tax=Aquabacterium olei TaxID=1296669 RepID=A0A2U8FNI0_9BURK|nr:SDR family oxidoreductase [Aquabacterium olei]AWI52611.1 short-chain dehydrogenase [Aquabacterium olei]